MLTTQREGRTEIIYYVIPLIATVSMAVVSDFRDWRIPNRLIAVGMIQGFLMSAVVRGPCDGLLSSVAGCVIPVVILFVLFHKKALGAGDIKLLATAGSRDRCDPGTWRGDPLWCGDRKRYYDRRTA